MLLHCEELTTTKTMPFRRNPWADWGCGRYLCSEPQVDAKTSTSVSRLDLAGKTHPRWSRYGWYRSLVRDAPCLPDTRYIRSPTVVQGSVQEFVQ